MEEKKGKEEYQIPKFLSLAQSLVRLEVFLLCFSEKDLRHFPEEGKQNQSCCEDTRHATHSINKIERKKGS